MATKKQIVAGHRRRMTRIANELRAMSEEWIDVDSGNEWLLDGLSGQVEDAIAELYTEESSDE